MALIVLRIVFVLLALGLGASFANSTLFLSSPGWVPWVVFGGVMFAALAIVVIDIGLRKKRVDTISAVYFGIVVGLSLAYVLRSALLPLVPNDPRSAPWWDWTQVVLSTMLCYACISMLLQTKDDFRFIIPYVEFAKEVKGMRPYVLDTSVVIDGRIADVVATGVMDSQLIMPRFVIAELQAIADSGDRLRRSRGRRGLDILNRLRTDHDVDLKIFDQELPEFAGQPVDLKLVLLAKHLRGSVVTNDYNLNKVAQLHGVDVINLNDLANALKPQFLPGETFEVRIVKPGEEAGQGVGYLDDGTMIVIDGGREHVQRTVRVAVTSVLQTSAGRMVFGKFDGAAPAAKAEVAVAAAKG